MFCLMSCVLRIGSCANFLSSIDWNNWMHLEYVDIKLMGVANFIDDYNECPNLCIPINKLENITISVVPTTNVAEDPLNKYIGIEELETTLDQTLTSISPDEIVNAFGSQNVSTLLREITDAVKPQLEEAIQKRLDILVDLKNKRVENAFSQSLKVVNAMLSTALSSGDDIENTWQTLVQQIETANLPNVVKKTLVYPVVKQQLIVAENEHQKGEKEKIHYYLEKIIPFLKEGWIKEDERIVNELPHELAKEELENKLFSQYTSLIEEAMVDARGVDNFLTNLYNDDDTDRMSSDLLQKIIDEEYMHAIKKAVSIYLYFSRKIFANLHFFPIEKYTSCDTIPQENVNHLIKLVGSPADWRHSLKIVKNYVCQALGEKFRRRDIRAIPQIDRVFKVMRILFEETIRNSCMVYKKENESFTKESVLKMAEVLNSLLETKYKEINESDIKVLKTQFSKYRTYWKFPQDVIKVAENLQNFQEEMEMLAETSYNFTPGTFIYSESYFEVLEELSPVRNNSIDDDIPLKTEL